MGTAPWGGSEMLWSGAAEQMKSRGYDVIACVSRWKRIPPKIVKLREKGINITFKPSLRAPQIVQGLYSMLRLPRFWLACAKPKFVVVSQGGNSGGLEWLLACKRLHIPYAIIVQANAESWWPGDQKAERMISAYQTSKNVFFVADANKRLLELQLGLTLHNASVIQNPISIAGQEALPWPRSTSNWKFAVVARLEPGVKGQDVLFQVLSRQHWRNRPIEVNLYGSGPCKKSIERMIKKLELTRVCVRGYVEDIREIWTINHLLILPSRLEGTPLALLEAMWCARPSLITDVGGNCDWCMDSKTGFVCKALHPDLLDETLSRAWLQREEWKTMGQSAYQYVANNYQRDPIGNFCDKLEALGFDKKYNEDSRQSAFEPATAGDSIGRNRLEALSE